MRAHLPSHLLSLCPALLTSLLGVGLAAPARAETSPAAGFVLVDGSGDGSHFTANLALHPGDDVMYARSRLHGQYITDLGIGGYLGVAGMTSFFGAGESYDAVGNLQLGAVAERQLCPLLRMGGRLGLMVPTMIGDDFGPVAYRFATADVRPGEVASAVPGATWLRLAVSPTVRRGRMVARADLGVDIPIVATGGHDVIGHASLGLGMRSGAVSTTVEFQAAVGLGGGDRGPQVADDVLHTGGLALRYHGERLAPYLALSTPAAAVVRGELPTFTFGVTAPL